MSPWPILQVARKEIGTTENPKNSNHVKYNTWYYGGPVSGKDFAWCMVFVQWIFDQAGMTLPYRSASCRWSLEWYKQNLPSWVIYSDPQPGDIVIYNFGHTGIVESAGPGTITAIEGNTSFTDKGSQSNGGAVARRTRPTSLVTAYIRPRYEKEDDMKEQVYQKLDDMPAVYRPTIEKLIKAEYVRGTAAGLDMPRTMARVLVILDRAGVFD